MLRRSFEEKGKDWLANSSRKLKSLIGTDAQAGDDSGYSLEDHLQFIGLQSITTSTHRTDRSSNHHHCIDASRHYVESKEQQSLVKNPPVIQDFCHPFRSFSEVQELWMGVERVVSSAPDDPLAVRTIVIRIRPDCVSHTVLQSVQDAFEALHAQHRLVRKQRDGQIFQAIGCDGQVPYLFDAQLLTSKQTQLDRQLLVRFYHTSDITLMEEELQVIGGIPSQQSPLKVPKAVQHQLQEACALLKLLSYPELPQEACRPFENQDELSQYLRKHFLESWSISEENLRVAQNPELPKRTICPSLSGDDQACLTESFALVTRIFSELEYNKCTYNTLVADPTCRFGMRPCKPTFDNHYCAQLARISQDRMLLELKQHVEEAESVHHKTHDEYNHFINLLRYSYKNVGVRFPEDMVQDDELMKDIAVKLPQKSIPENFHWSPVVAEALRDVARRFVDEQLYLVENDPYQSKLNSLQLTQESVEHVYTAFTIADDEDQKQFLKEYSRLSLKQLVRRQAILRDVMNRLSIRTSQRCQQVAERWFQLAQQATNEEGFPTQQKLHPEVPLLEFETFSGKGCVTASYIIIVTQRPLLGLQVSVFELAQVDVRSSNGHMTKMTVMLNGKKVHGFNPSVGAEELATFVSVLKSIQGH